MLIRTLAQALGAELRWANTELPSPWGTPENFHVTGVASVEGATSFSVVFAENLSTLQQALEAPTLRAIITTPGLFQQAKPLLAQAHNPEDFWHRELPRAGGRKKRIEAVLLHPQPRWAFAHAARLLAGGAGDDGRLGVHPTAAIARSAGLGAGCTVGAHAVIEEGATLGDRCQVGAGAVLGPGVELGPDCRIYPRAVLYPGTRLGARVVVHAGAVLGADGFGYVRDRVTGAYIQFPQQGTLVVEDDVEIGANTTVDRGALQETRIGRGTKLDNLVHVGHNVRIGADVVIAAQTGISGSSAVGDGAVVAGQVGIADHVEIGPGVILGAQGGVPSHKRLQGPGQVFWGTPARPIAQYLRELAQLARWARRGARARSTPGQEDEA